MKINRYGILSLLAVMTSLVFANVYALEDPVQLDSGKVSGVALNSGIKVYRGIPFAAAPVGDLRWRPPASPIPWQGILEASSFSPICMQQPRSEPQVLMSEDCLYLNVWTPANSAQQNLPVMVWIHGGGWAFGSSSSDTYDGEGFALKGVILVSVNYRMGPFGFMAHSLLSAESERGVSGNYGLLDHISALQWVQENISGFGGDPDNVTIFGESAGGGSVYSLIASPLAAGLFDKAISQSTWIHTNNTTRLRRANGFMDSAEAIGDAAVNEKLQELGKLSQGGNSNKNVLAIMRALPATDVLAIPSPVTATADGWVLPKPAAEIFAEGSHNHVPLLAGTNDGEGLYYIRARPLPYSTVAEQFKARATEYGESATDVLNYYVAKTDADVVKMEIDYITDTTFARASRELVYAMAQTVEPTWMYQFTRNPDDPSQRSPHAAELRYVFQTLNPTDVTSVDMSISDNMSSYWVQFAKSGNPNGTGLPDWPAYTLETERYQIIGAEYGQGSFLRKQELDALDQYIYSKNALAK
ncbi:MAG: carboxylesterase family protein [Gammaproteobacteria bacterium]|nr:carboxylesterase family protein [Gammaproteobacteria bacterium]